MITVEQDGVRTDERVRASRWLARFEPTRPASRIVLRTLLVADVGLLLATGTLFALFMERPAGFVFAGCCWALAALLINASCVARWLARRRDR
jgi:hypothetical protein